MLQELILGNTVLLEKLQKEVSDVESNLPP